VFDTGLYKAIGKIETQEVNTILLRKHGLVQYERQNPHFEVLYGIK
jgi:hypothetical protein